jgi:hypothetical protein
MFASGPSTPTVRTTLPNGTSVGRSFLRAVTFSPLLQESTMDGYGPDHTTLQAI